jgi:hypothetical protein
MPIPPPLPSRLLQAAALRADARLMTGFIFIFPFEKIEFLGPEYTRYIPGHSHGHSSARA